MTREQILNSIQLKKRFCKDCNLPIAVFDNPYFYERLCTLDILFDCIDKFDNFCSELLTYPDEQSYFEHYNYVKDAMIDHIKSKSNFIRFNEQNFTAHQIVAKRNLYTDPNDGKTFISIDMRKANFSALHHFSKDIFDDCDTWEEFVEMFTESKHISNSKYIRQVVLGACNPQKQIQYEHNLMSLLCAHIYNNIDHDKFEIYSLGTDEILIEVKEIADFDLTMLKKAIAFCPDGIGSLVRIELFELRKVSDIGWMKYKDDYSVSFKCVNAEIFHQIVKHYFGHTITENDLVFYHDGKLARFLETVKNPWSE